MLEQYMLISCHPLLLQVWSRVVLRVHTLYDILPPATIVLQVESKSAATELEARAILHLQQMGVARVLNLRVGGRAR